MHISIYTCLGITILFILLGILLCYTPCKLSVLIAGIRIQGQINTFRISATESISLDSNVLGMSSSSLCYLKYPMELSSVCPG